MWDCNSPTDPESSLHSNEVLLLQNCCIFTFMYWYSEYFFHHCMWCRQSIHSNEFCPSVFLCLWSGPCLPAVTYPTTRGLCYPRWSHTHFKQVTVCVSVLRVLNRTPAGRGVRETAESQSHVKIPSSLSRQLKWNYIHIKESHWEIQAETLLLWIISRAHCSIFHKLH